MNGYKKYLYNLAPLKILSFLSLYPGEIFTASEIAEQTQSSRGGTNQTLRMLNSLDIIARQHKGNLYLYKLNHNNPILKHFKIFDNLLNLHSVIKELQPHSYKIVLFGSYANGLSTEESDIDLFIKTDNKNKVQKIITRHITVDFKISPVIQTPLELASSENKDKVFYNQVKKGIVLWEGRPTYDET